VEKIVGKRFHHGRPQVLVKWVGFPDEEISWEPMENVANAIGLLCDFEAELNRLKENAMATLKKDLPPSPSTSAVSLVDQSPKKSSKSKKKSKAKQENTSSTVSAEESNKKPKGKGKVGRSPVPKQNNKNSAKAFKELASSSHSGNGHMETFNKKPLETPSTKKTASIPGHHGQFRVLNLSDSSDEETLGATSLEYQRSCTPKQSIPMSPKPLALFLEDAPQIGPSVSQNNEAEEDSQDEESDSSSSNSSSASSGSSSSSGSSRSRSRSSSSSSTSSEETKPVPETASLDTIKEAARKWDAEKRVAKLNDLLPKSVSPNIGTNNPAQPETKKTRRQSSVQRFQSPIDDSIDTEPQRVRNLNLYSGNQTKTTGNS